jgi:hypothetical protein
MATTVGGTAVPTTRRRTDHIFFCTIITAIVAAVFIGFAHTYFWAGIFRAKLPSLLVHIHGALFTSWIALLAAQVVLASIGRIRWHMKLGVLGMFLAPLMVVVGFATLVAAVRRHFVSPAGVRIIFVGDTLTLCIFAGLVLWAFLARRDAPAHKRLMLLATCIILGPAISRWPFHFVENAVGFFIVLDSFVLLLVLYDLWKLRTLHRATVWGVLLTAAWQFAYAPLAHSQFVDHLVVWMQKA